MAIEKETADNADGAENHEPVFRSPAEVFHPLIVPQSKTVWNMGLGENEKLAWNAHHPLSRSATGRGRKLARLFRDVRANHGEIAVVQLPDVRAAIRGVA